MRTLALLLCGGVCLVGCGGRNIQVANDFKQLGLAYHNYYDAHKKPPSGPDDLIPFMEGSEAIVQKVKDGQYVLIWGVDLREAIKQGGGESVLGYEKDAPTRGGEVLFLGGEVKRLTAEEFGKAPKASPTGSAPK